MNNDDLRLSNYNYRALDLLERIRNILARDRQFLGAVLQRSALVRSSSGDIEHCITRIDVLAQHASTPPPQLLDYGRMVFLRETIDQEAFITRVSALDQQLFTSGQYTFSSKGMGFSDRYQPSCNQYADWPATLFEVSFGSSQVGFEPLLHPALKSFGSPFEAIREFLGFQQFNDSSDSRLGHILICIPNFNARIEKLQLTGRQLAVTVEGEAQSSSLKLDVSYKNASEATSISIPLTERKALINLAYTPSQLLLWLVSRNGFLADFHEENEFYSVGSNAVLLKKKQAYAPIYEPVFAPEDNVALQTELPITNKVFVIHGHNVYVKESVARLLEKLGLVAVILHEQPNSGATIMEKFQQYSDVSFAIALLTGDDEARVVATEAPMKRRARQNVLFEFGYFIGTLGRKRVCALVEKDVEIPSDYQGVIFIPIDSHDAWKFSLVREMKAAGMDVDANLAL